MGLLNKNYGLALLAGLSCVFGFAPFGIYPVPVLALAVLFVLWLRAESPCAAAWSGFAFGLGLFGAGIGWIYVALHDYGGMPVLLALLSTFLFTAFLALFPALAGYAQARLPAWGWIRAGLAMPAAWVLSEWLRGTIFTGFPWLAMGYAHNASPLSGYAPIFGVYGVSLLASVSAGLLACMFEEMRGRCVCSLQPLKIAVCRNEFSGGEKRTTLLRFLHGGGRRFTASLAVLLALWVCGALLRSAPWTLPHGVPFNVALVQGNIAQELKFKENVLADTMETYRRLTLQYPAQLIVLPETALPLLRRQIPQTMVDQLRGYAKENNGDVLLGAFERNNGGYYNSVFTLGISGEQQYHKQHLVPFGEFVPMRPLFGRIINDLLNIPMGDLARGEARQTLINVAGQRVAVNICYEDAFGEEIIRSLPQATLLVNVTNDAWYGYSHAAAQHNQISQMRALETGRMMLRATNTGVTSIIGANGKILQQLPQHQEGVLTGMAQGYDGITPYVRYGNAAVMLLIAAMLACVWMRRTTYSHAQAKED